MENKSSSKMLEQMDLVSRVELLVGVILKTNMTLLKCKSTDKKLNQEIAHLLSIYQNIYDEYLDGPDKDDFIRKVTGAH